MKRILYASLLLIAMFHFLSCENELTVGPDFSVQTLKTTYDAGEEVTFLFDNAADWMVFYSGEESRKYPDDRPVGIKSITNSLKTFSYVYNSPGTYECVFVGGVTNYKTDKKQVYKIAIIIN